MTTADTLTARPRSGRLASSLDLLTSGLAVVMVAAGGRNIVRAAQATR